ncbi:hypothetical protein PR048_028795 [Dryococelus australis]|uniref:Uncharacterized protein n=1 Tax=Dryococelus australis TaxID=614101 RepID=A0ABQ9GE79_9NEOP|nr:hypothetical protein PR048_028795 [Dryococelus australis]
MSLAHFLLRRVKTGCQNCSKERKFSGWRRNREFEHIEKDIASLTHSADELAQKAEDHGDMTLIVSSNALRQTANEKTAQLDNLKKAISLFGMPLKYQIIYTS